MLLPTISGTGLSIKTVEALSSGLPIIATPQALRGMDAEAFSLSNVTVAEFGGGLRRRPARRSAGRFASGEQSEPRIL